MSNNTSSSIGGSIGGMPQMQADFQKQKNLFSQLTQAVNSGDLSAASSALQQIQSNAPRNPGAGSTSTTVQQDFAALSSAISSGNATSAQQALQKLQSDMKAMQGSHHKRPSAAQNASTPTATAAQVLASDEDSNSGSSSSSSSSGSSSIRGGLNSQA